MCTAGEAFWKSTRYRVCCRQGWYYLFAPGNIVLRFTLVFELLLSYVNRMLM